MKIVLLVCAIFFSLVSSGQTIPDFDMIKLEQAKHYKAAEPFAMQTAVYLLTTPVEKNSDNRLKSVQFLYKWMSGTPDHSFVLQEMAELVGKDNQVIFGLYMAAMVKASLDHKALPKDQKLVKLNAINMVLDYCENKTNNAKMTKQVKKLSEAKAKGELEQML